MWDEAFFEVGIKAADAARALLRERFATPQNIILKADQSPVTEADRACEQAITNIIREAFPAHGIFGEEFGKTNESVDYQWVIDPIDGTRAFLAGYPTFTTLIALCYLGKPIMGIIDNPILGERFIGISWRKSTKNNAEIHTSHITTLPQALIGTTSAPYHFSATESAAFERIRSQCMNTVIGGDAYGYAMLANGRIDLFIDTGLKPYDFCALAPIIEGAGGVITDWEGKPITLTSDGKTIAAANKQLHTAAMTTK